MFKFQYPNFVSFFRNRCWCSEPIKSHTYRSWPNADFCRCDWFKIENSSNVTWLIFKMRTRSGSLKKHVVDSETPRTFVAPKKHKKDTPISAPRNRGRPRGSTKKRWVQTVNLTPFRDVATQTEPFFVAVTTTHDDVTNTQQHDQWNQPAVRVTVKDAMIMLVGAGFFSCAFCFACSWVITILALS